MSDIWNKIDKDKFDKAIAKKQEESIIANNKKEWDNISFFKSAINNNYLLSNQFIQSLIVLKKFCLFYLIFPEQIVFYH